VTKPIGLSIHEAIDWVQDRLTTTRPVAEETLFTLITSKQVIETDAGFVLTEAEEDDEGDKLRHHLKSKKGKRRRGFRARHDMRLNSQQPMKLDANMIAEQMMAGKGRGRGKDHPKLTEDEH